MKSLCESDGERPAPSIQDRGATRHGRLMHDSAAAGNPRVSIIVVNWNGLKHTLPCVDSLLQSDYPDLEVIVSDNGSTDGSAEMVEAKFPQVRVVRNGANLGFGAAVMTAAKVATGDYFAVLNNDVEAAPDWLSELVRVARTEGFAATASLLVFEQDPTMVNAAGGDMNFGGLGWPRAYRRPRTDVSREPHEVAFCAGGVTLYERRAFEEVGGFDPAYFLYVEDSDLSWRLRLAGHRCGLAPNAVLKHDWDFHRNPRKLYHIQRNRIIMVIRNWSTPALIILAPGLLILETATTVGAFSQGWGRLKLEADRDALRVLRNTRGRGAALVRRRREGDIARVFRGGLHHPEVRGPLVRYVLNPVLGAYWWVARPLIGLAGR